MNDLSKAFLWSNTILFGSAAVGMVVDAVVPWNVGTAVGVTLMFAGLGFTQRWNISNHVEDNPETSPVNLHLTKKGFVSQTIGRWWNPLHIGSKLSHHSLVGGRYTWSTNEIDINLPVVVSMAEQDSFPPDTVEEAATDVIEHEAIHCAIHTNAESIYTGIEQAFRDRFRNASILSKAKLYLGSIQYHFGGSPAEEPMIERLQAERRELTTFVG